MELRARRTSWTVLAPNLRGHGHSDVPPDAFGVRGVAEGAAAGVERAVLPHLPSELERGDIPHRAPSRSLRMVVGREAVVPTHRPGRP